MSNPEYNFFYKQVKKPVYFFWARHLYCYETAVASHTYTKAGLLGKAKNKTGINFILNRCFCKACYKFSVILKKSFF